MVRSTAISPVLSFTIMMSELTMLNAATRMISVRIRNITFFSTSTAEKKLLLLCCQSTTRNGMPGRAARMARFTSPTRSGSFTITSIWLTALGIMK